MPKTFSVTVPDKIAAELEEIAREDGLSTEQMLVKMATIRANSMRKAREFFEARARSAGEGALERVFGTHRSGGEPPRPGDEAD